MTLAGSTDAGYDNYAPKATDGDPVTRWSSEWGADPSWIAVDLGDVFQVDHVNLSWEWSYAKRYQIQVSLDGESWTSVYETDQGKGNREEIFFDLAQARYVRVFCIQRALQWGYSLYEVEVFQAR
ncbi:MAG: discoidin domain-containing protein [Candidatus Limiplasma sp.]|nr:discoidin domain-containing protein [Candidatus Limiplasma sp.]